MGSTAKSALMSACGGYNGEHTNNFTCNDFGGYNASNPPKQKATVVVGGGLYEFEQVGNGQGGHWKLQ